MSNSVALTTILRAGDLATFAYGTIRPNEWNDHWSHSRPPRLDGRVKGRIYYVNQSGGYPVAKLDEEGLIVGDVIYPTPDSFGAIWRMEEGAGYRIRRVPVFTPKGVPFMEAWCWHYVWNPMGREIPSGDWRKDYATLSVESL